MTGYFHIKDGFQIVHIFGKVTACDLNKITKEDMLYMPPPPPKGECFHFITVSATETFYDCAAMVRREAAVQDVRPGGTIPVYEFDVIYPTKLGAL